MENVLETAGAVEAPTNAHYSVQTYTYQLRPVNIPKDVELLSLGSVYLYNEDVLTENGNVYVSKEYIGVFIRTLPVQEKPASVELFLTKDMGDKICCLYPVVPRNSVYYLDGYTNMAVIKDIYVQECESLKTDSVSYPSDIATRIQND